MMHLVRSKLYLAEQAVVVIFLAVRERTARGRGFTFDVLSRKGRRIPRKVMKNERKTVIRVV